MDSSSEWKHTEQRVSPSRSLFGQRKMMSRICFLLSLERAVPCLSALLPCLGQSRRKKELAAHMTTLARKYVVALILHCVVPMSSLAISMLSMVVSIGSGCLPLDLGKSRLMFHISSLLCLVQISRMKKGRHTYNVTDRKSTRLNSSHSGESRMPSSA